jgi:hypothetical protein
MAKLRTGGRVVLELGEADARAARYRVTLSTPDGEWRGDAEVVVDGGAVTIAAWTPGEPPAWLVKWATTFLRGAWREAREPGGAWPRRFDRWREARAPG